MHVYCLRSNIYWYQTDIDGSRKMHWYAVVVLSYQSAKRKWSVAQVVHILLRECNKPQLFPASWKSLQPRRTNKTTHRQWTRPHQNQCSCSRIESRLSQKLLAETSQNSHKWLSMKSSSVLGCLHFVENTSGYQVRLACLSLSSSFR